MKLRAFIRGDVVFEPGVVQFDSVTPGQGAAKHVTVSYAGRQDWQILEAAGTSSDLAVSFKETGRNYEPNLGATQVTYDLAVSLKGTPPPGYFKEKVILKTNDQNQQTARVPLAVEGYVAAPLTVNPAMLMLGAVKPNQSVSKVLVVSGATPFRVVRVTGPDDQFSFTPAADAKKVHVIGVHFTAGNKPGKVSGKNPHCDGPRGRNRGRGRPGPRRRLGHRQRAQDRRIQARPRRARPHQGRGQHASHRPAQDRRALRREGAVTGEKGVRNRFC